MFDLLSIVNKYYAPDEVIILACSTGPDSMFLLYQLLKVVQADRVVACYFNHHLRPESDEEEEFLKDLARERGFAVEIGDGDIKKIKEALYPSISLEELSRIKRYTFFGAVCQIYDSNKIMTAHHLDDRIETFFFNLLRGSKLTGLINMTEFHGKILRPLLGLEKDTILQSLHQEGLAYRVDASNAENIYTRNHLRNEIIPQMYRVNQQFKKNIAQTLDYFSQLKEHIDAEVHAFMALTPGIINLREFETLGVFLQKEIIKEMYYICNHRSTQGLSEANIAEILRFFQGKNNPTHKTIKGLKMKKQKHRVSYTSG